LSTSRPETDSFRPGTAIISAIPTSFCEASLFGLSEDEIHLWLASPGECTDRDLIDSALPLLSADEVARMECLLFPEDRQLFLVSHLLVRTALSHYADRSPDQWRFVRSNRGGPQIDPKIGPTGLSFSLSHTRGLAVVAVTRDRNIGVDAERMDRPVNARGLINRFFSPPEAAELAKLPSGQLHEHFFLYWTLKEACIKALGIGPSPPLRSFGFRLSGDRPYRIGFSGRDSQDAGNQLFALLEPLPQYIVAVSAAGDPSKPTALRCYHAVPLRETTPCCCAPIGLSCGVVCPRPTG
jgi:4'-phosphopantetheinyl transferase